MMKNKIIRKYLLPRIIFMGTMAGIIVPLSYDIVRLRNEVNEVDAKHKALDPFFLSCTAFVTAVLIWYVLGSIKCANKLAVGNARNYITKAIKENPELADFQSVLSNDRAMKHVAATIANNLRPSEQKQVRDIVLKTDLFMEPSKRQEVYNQVEQVIRDHIHVHPEFLPNLYGEMAWAEHNYIICAKHKNNKQR